MMLSYIPPWPVRNNETIMPSLRLTSFVLLLILVQQRANVCFPKDVLWYFMVNYKLCFFDDKLWCFMENFGLLL